MATDVLTQEQPADLSEDDDDLIHLVCCDNNTALCGVDVSDASWVDGDNECVPCPLCALADESRCLRCGVPQ